MVLCSQSNGFCYMAYSIWIFRKSNNSWVQKMGPNIIIWHSVSVKMLLFPNFCIGSVLLILIFYVIYWIALWSVFVSLWLIHWFWLIGFLNLFIVYTDKLSVVEEIKDEYVTILAKFYIYIYTSIVYEPLCSSALCCKEAEWLKNHWLVAKINDIRLLICSHCRRKGSIFSQCQ